MIPSHAAAVAPAVPAVQAIEAAAVAFLSLCRPALSHPHNAHHIC